MQDHYLWHVCTQMRVCINFCMRQCACCRSFKTFSYGLKWILPQQQKYLALLLHSYKIGNNVIYISKIYDTFTRWPLLLWHFAVLVIAFLNDKKYYSKWLWLSAKNLLWFELIFHRLCVWIFKTWGDRSRGVTEKWKSKGLILTSDLRDGTKSG